MQQKPLSILHSIAEHYLRDGEDFAARFDLLWEHQLHKTGRVKSFVDLLMACECTLKAHVAIGRANDDPSEVYRSIRRAGHQIAPLAAGAHFLKDRTVYDSLSSRLQEFSVFVRYSLDAYETFFPFFVERKEAKIEYSKTIGDNNWVLETRALLTPLQVAANNVLSGFVNSDIEAILVHEQQMAAFMEVNAVPFKKA